MNPSRTYEESCRLLDVKAGCAPEELRRAFRRQTMLWHPDRFPPGSDLHAEAEERIKAINEAHAFLQAHPRPVPILLAPEGEPSRPAPTRRLTWGLLAVALALGSWLVGKRQEEPPRAAKPAPPAAPRSEAVPSERAALAPERPTTVVRSPSLVIFAPSPLEREQLPEAAARACEQFLRNALLVRERVAQQQSQQQQPLGVVLTHDQVIVYGAYSIEREAAGSFGYVLCFPQQSPSVIEGKKSVDEVLSAIVQSWKDYDAAVRARPRESSSPDNAMR